LKKGGFEIGDFSPNFGEVWFYKDIHGTDEAKETVKWLIDLKKKIWYLKAR
jgi:hypothetical protein